MKNVKNQKGFTMVELILVMTILGILAVAALPSFIDVTATAGNSASAGVIGAVREGISLQHAQQMANGNDVWVATLENGAAATPWFDGVLSNGVEDTRWTSADGLTYTYNADGTGNDLTCVYDAAGGFTCS